MRDILNKLNPFLSEENLGASQIPPTKVSTVANPKTGKIFSRPELFLHKVITQSPFQRDDTQEEVVIDPKEAKKVRDWLATGPKGTVTLKTLDGTEIKNTQLRKTVEFGSKEAETIKLKGSDIFSTQKADVQDFGNSIEDVLKAGGFPASEMYSKIADNPAVQKLGRIGDAVIYMARQVNQGQVPEFPDNLSDQEKKAIELYASEYLGVLGLLTGTTKFERRKDFDKFLGTNLNDMIMFFPKDVSNPLADSFSVVNDDTGHAIKISSKAAGKGAPPSLSSLKLPEEVREKYPEAASFFDMATLEGLSAYTQPFAMMNWLFENAPSAVPNSYKSLLPFDSNTIATLQAGLKGAPVPRRIMSVFEKRLSQDVLTNKATDAGRAWYAVTKDVMRAVNKENAVPNLQEAIIESLGYNFVQLYTEQKGNRLMTKAFWPAKVTGQVRLRTKGSSLEPTKGKISVEISPGKNSDMGPETGAGVDTDTTKPQAADSDQEPPRTDIKAAGEIEPKMGNDTTLGRKRRKRF
jgi:hypothetical protein